jgi:hypothetical protein
MSSFKDVCASLSLLLKGLTDFTFRKHDAAHRSIYCEICALNKNGEIPVDHIGQNEARFVIIAGSRPFRLCTDHHPNAKVGALSDELHEYLEQHDLVWTDLYVMDHDSRKFT